MRTWSANRGRKTAQILVRGGGEEEAGPRIKIHGEGRLAPGRSKLKSQQKEGSDERTEGRKGREKQNCTMNSAIMPRKKGSYGGGGVAESWERGY